MMRHRIATWFFLACLTAHAQVPEYVPTDGLLSWSNLNVFDGAIVVGGAVPDTGRFGIAENAYHFDGTNDVIEVQVEEGLPCGNDARSTSIWFNAESFDSWLPVTLVHYGIPATNNRWFLLLSSDYPHIGAHNNDLCPPCTCAGCTEVTVTENQQPLLPNMWHHMAVTHDGQTMRVYVDGQLHFYGDKQFNTVETNVFNVGFSDATHNGGEPFLGKLQSVGMWDRALTEEEVTQLHLGELPEFGCTDSNACNFDAEANMDDGSCYPCDIPAAHCGPGTVWDASAQLCVGGNPSDTDFDGCVGMADLLDLLSSFGTCAEVEPNEDAGEDSDEDPNSETGSGADAWSCGDSLAYQGYDYETVQIGEQCWFAENLRAENYQNGDVIPANLPDSVWASTTEGAVAVYGEGDSPIIFGSANEVQNLLIYGRMYNSFACADERNLCPSGWRVPFTSDFNDLTSWAQENSIDSLGVKLRHVDTWYFNNISTDEFGFGWKAGGNKVSGGAFNGQRLFGQMMVSDCPCWAELKYDWNIEYQVEGLYDGPQMAASVRCIKNAE